MTSDFLNQWLALCYDTVGRELPINYIDERAVGFMLPLPDPPLITKKGQYTRFIVLTHGPDMEPNA